MLSDCTKGFLYSQISSGWITRWNGSKNSVKLKVTIEYIYIYILKKLEMKKLEKKQKTYDHLKLYLALITI